MYRFTPTTWADTRAGRRARRAQRCTHRALQQELAGFSTPTEVAELSAILGRSDEPSVAEVRDLVLLAR